MALLLSLIGLVLVFVTRRKLFGDPRFLERIKKSDNLRHLSVIIPARNEAENIAAILGTIPETVGEIIVVDDHSDDDTAELAAAAGARVINAKPLPKGWQGKPWALQQGAEAARGEKILFSDADVRFGPQAIESLASIKGDAVSVCPWHDVRLPYEQNSAFFNLLMVAGVGAAGSIVRQPRLFGQVCLFQRDLFLQGGGYEAVKEKVLENLHLSTKTRLHPQSLLTRGMISMRMFPHGLDELIASWSKGVKGGRGAVSSRVISYSAFYFTGLFLTLIGLLLSVVASLPLLLTGLLCYLFVGWSVNQDLAKVGSYSRWVGFAYPLPLIFYQWVFLRASLTDKSVQWKGRDVY